MKKSLKNLSLSAVLLGVLALAGCGAKALTAEEAMDLLGKAAVKSDGLTKHEAKMEMTVEYSHEDEVVSTTEMVNHIAVDNDNEKAIVDSLLSMSMVEEGETLVESLYGADFYQDGWVYSVMEMKMTGEEDFVLASKMEMLYEDFCLNVSGDTVLLPQIGYDDFVVAIEEDGTFVSGRQSGNKTTLVYEIFIEADEDEEEQNFEVTIVIQNEIITLVEYSETGVTDIYIGEENVEVTYVGHSKITLSDKPVFDFSVLDNYDFDADIIYL